MNNLVIACTVHGLELLCCPILSSIGLCLSQKARVGTDSYHDTAHLARVLGHRLYIRDCAWFLPTTVLCHTRVVLMSLDSDILSPLCESLRLKSFPYVCWMALRKIGIIVHNRSDETSGLYSNGPWHSLLHTVHPLCGHDRCDTLYI